MEIAYSAGLMIGILIFFNHFGKRRFISMFVIGVLAIIIQMLLMVDTRLVLGEIVTVLVGGILYIAIMVYNGIWDKCLPKSSAIWRNFLTSVICAGIFTVPEKLVAKDTDARYPETPKEVIKLFGRINQCIYNKKLSDGEYCLLQAKAL